MLPLVYPHSQVWLPVLQVLLEFWSPADHDCWTLLLSSGPIPKSDGGHYCVLLHDLIRQSVPVGASALPEQRVLDMARCITGTRAMAVLDQYVHLYLPLMMKHVSRSFV